MLADCDRCELRDIACTDCMITALPGGQAEIGEAERLALAELASAGLVAPLRFAPAVPRSSLAVLRFLREAVETALALH
jgi:hypothetical protein